VIASLSVAEGDWVEKGQVLAILDDHALRAAEVARLEAELVNATSEAERARRLSRQSVTSAANLDSAELGVRVAEANLAAARARLELTRIRAPIRGQILEIHTRPGERAGAEGVLEIGDTQQMVAVAEVYETDIGGVEKGQRARITSPALDGPLLGVVGSVGLKIGRMDTLGTDPIAKTDARVVEVRIELDSSESVAALTNLQVEVEIER
jgi:HlyD family secretion protein